MYLKRLEVTGFKSFADRTKLDFEPGMTAIVGPNGCGKSNVSDALRWVIGETSAKALRGSKMEDCIFNGTDARKPLSMAEASITFADCEGVLATEFNEVSVSRRVFRSGEGEYFINKTPCRLKDIQRLFMDTGIGTTSYSLMEQGRIDQILSSRPEDRRTIFEEASGITKFKADKKEAIRKLDHTEANLLRLADVIREVKRQIGSLQRQAGKARRYKTMKEELRALDLFASCHNLTEADRGIHDIESQIADLNARVSAAHDEVEAMEQQNAERRRALVGIERDIGGVLESGVQAQSQLDHTHERIELNRKRIEEYQTWSQRDSKEIEDTGKQIETHEAALQDFQTKIDAIATEKNVATHRLESNNERFNTHHHEVEQVRAHIRNRREESVELESLASRLQNQLVEIESRERSTVIRKERLAAEKSQLTRVLETYETRQTEVANALTERTRQVDTAAAAVAALEACLEPLRASLREADRTLVDLRARDAGVEARLELLGAGEDAEEDFPAGTRQLLDEANPLSVDRTAILGPLADAIHVDAPYTVALEIALRAWLDAVLVTDIDAARSLVRTLQDRKAGASRLLAVQVAAANDAPPPEGSGVRLADHVRCEDATRPLVERLIGNVRVVDALDDIPFPIPPRLVYVTFDGCLLRGDGGAELWITGAQAANPLSRKHMLDTNRRNRDALASSIRATEQDHARLTAELQALDTSLLAARESLEEKRRHLAQKEGENDIVSGETIEARQRLETVAWEFGDLNGPQEPDGSTRDDVIRQIEEIREKRQHVLSQMHADTERLHDLEGLQTELQTAVTEARIHFAQISQQLDHLKTQRTALDSRLGELRSARDGRVAGIHSYESGMQQLNTEIADAESRLASLEEAVNANKARTEALHKARDEQAESLIAMEASLAEKRTELETVRNAKSEKEIRYTECRMRRQNLLDRVMSEYNVTVEQVMDAPEPDWGEADRPTPDTLDTEIAELRTKLDAMGPVNLVAIEEYQELEERYNFLTKQEEDLVNAKQQLHDMIRKINRTTSEMFRSTFDAVNEKFQSMFQKLFDGGSAKLVLVNEEDVLECGIEIIARPPGKRLQNITLLSGGERTLTAVSLLLAIYMIKPSPFCLLDELDAALDDSNIGRFVNVLKDFLTQSQFVVITHNRQTIAAADTMYGVTMPEKGISKIVSMRFNQEAQAASTS